MSRIILCRKANPLRDIRAKPLGAMQYTIISKYERNKSEPPITAYLLMARAANVPLESIVDDEIELKS